jgi:hypothetical protein
MMSRFKSEQVSGEKAVKSRGMPSSATLRTLARRAGVDLSTMRRVLAGERVSERTALRVSFRLGLPIRYINQQKDDEFLVLRVWRDRLYDRIRE